MKLSDLNSNDVGRYAHLAINGKTYSGPIRHIRSHDFPGTDPRLAGHGTPPADHWTVDIYLDTVAFDGLSPDTEIQLLERLPPRIPTDSRTFPDDVFAEMAGSRLRELTIGSMGAVTVKLADGREGTYELSTNPQQRGWLLARH